MSRPGSIVAMLLSFLVAPIASGGGQDPLLNTSTGVLRGIRQGPVRAFLGIPYAEPPTGRLRWRAPESVTPWHGVRDASHFGASCFQPWPVPMFGPYTPEYVTTPQPSEDCLFLNVWSPAKHSGKMPVLLWIHGGAFLGGSGAIEIYGGRHLAERGIVVVTINYRVGPFGFLALPQLRAESPQAGSGNYGLLDIIAALRWVQANIGAFGGDPHEITIAGQSAGAAAVNDLGVAPLAKGLFARAISESGSAMGVSPRPLKGAEADGQSFAQSLGTTGLDQLRALPATTLQSAVVMPFQAKVDRSNARPALPFSPVLDGVVLSADPEDPNTPVVSNVPLLTGYCADEAYAPTSTVSATDFERDVRSRYGSHAESILALYAHGDDSEAAASAAVLARDRYMASLLLWGRVRSHTAHQIVYAYLFEHPVPTARPPSWGTFHTAEVPYVFRNLQSTARPYTARDWAVADQLSDYWLNFVRHGDPNNRRQPTWAHLVESSSEVMGLGDSVGPRAAVSSTERLAQFQAIIADGGRLSLF
jgi:para-nitrobenzyl esterase